MMVPILIPHSAVWATLMPTSKGLGFFVAMVRKKVYCFCRFWKNESQNNNEQPKEFE
jgi:hypothetical protein